MGFAFLTTGVAFKIAAVPFHYWTPDAYQGSPTPVTGYLSVGPKVGAFALILRLFVEALGSMRADWLPVVVVLAAVTMTLGNLVALTQDNVKRMLAYSSIAHTGYMLVGLAAYAGGQAAGLEGLLFYGAAYSFMNLGAFAVIAALQKRAGVTSSLATFAGLVRREPALTFLMTLFLLSLIGIPPTAGFFAKVLIILPAVQAGGWVALPRGPRRPERRGGRVLLPPRDRLHVHARPGHRRAGAAARPAAVGRPRGRDRADDHPRPRAAADPRVHRPGREVDHRLTVDQRDGESSRRPRRGRAAGLVAARHPESCPMPHRASLRAARRVPGADSRPQLAAGG